MKLRNARILLILMIVIPAAVSGIVASYVLAISRAVDSTLIDGAMVNGSAGMVGLVAALARKLQTGYLYHYAFAMILGLVALLALARYFWL